MATTDRCSFVSCKTFATGSQSVQAITLVLRSSNLQLPTVKVPRDYHYYIPKLLKIVATQQMSDVSFETQCKRSLHTAHWQIDCGKMLHSRCRCCSQLQRMSTPVAVDSARPATDCPTTVQRHSATSYSRGPTPATPSVSRCLPPLRTLSVGSHSDFRWINIWYNSELTYLLSRMRSCQAWRDSGTDVNAIHKRSDANSAITV